MWQIELTRKPISRNMRTSNDHLASSSHACRRAWHSSSVRVRRADASAASRRFGMPRRIAFPDSLASPASLRSRAAMPFL